MFFNSKEPLNVCIAGTGKTMVMDMFYDHVDITKKKRVHFHGFMLDVHKSKCTSFKMPLCSKYLDFLSAIMEMVLFVVLC